MKFRRHIGINLFRSKKHIFLIGKCYYLLASNSGSFIYLWNQYINTIIPILFYNLNQLIKPQINLILLTL